MQTSLKAIAVGDAEASLSEEPSAVIPHAGIRAGGRRVTAFPTATGRSMDCPQHFCSERQRERKEVAYTFKALADR